MATKEVTYIDDNGDKAVKDVDISVPTRAVSKLVDYDEVVNGKVVTKQKRVRERIESTPDEITAKADEDAANEVQQLVDETNRKRKKLIAHERDKLIAPQRTAIENMDEAALDNAIDVAGL